MKRRDQSGQYVWLWEHLTILYLPSKQALDYEGIAKSGPPLILQALDRALPSGIISVQFKMPIKITSGLNDSGTSFRKYMPEVRIYIWLNMSGQGSIDKIALPSKYDTGLRGNRYIRPPSNHIGPVQSSAQWDYLCQFKMPIETVSGLHGSV